MITQDRLMDVISYNPDTGNLTWAVDRPPHVKAGDTAGSLRANGYVQTCIDGKLYLNHRLAYLYMTGELPEEVDHINRDRADNSWSNLRASDAYSNKQNTVRNNSFIGTAWNKRASKWKAYSPKVDGKETHLGYFTTHIAACMARHSHEVNHV